MRIAILRARAYLVMSHVDRTSSPGLFTRVIVRKGTDNLMMQCTRRIRTLQWPRLE